MRRAFAQQIVPGLQALAKHLKFLDEIGANLGFTRLSGRAAPGVRVVEATLGHSGPHYTAVAAIGLKGVSAPFIIEGAMDGLVFETYVEQVLAPTLRRGDIILMDNLSAHKREQVRTVIERRGARVEFLPPYSPDLNPIEKCWAKVKSALRSAKARTFDALVEALKVALRSVTLKDIQAWFTHCGYATP